VSTQALSPQRWLVFVADYGPTEPVGSVEASDAEKALRVAYERYESAIYRPDGFLAIQPEEA
jgi:1,2-phenylacetyl-CoA epoxidase PaaB subunit